MRNINDLSKASSCSELSELVHQIGLLPLLDSGITGYSADALVEDDCRYVILPDGGWDWPLWKWKGPIVTDGNCVYGKFFAGKAGFISMESIEEAILQTLHEQGSMITRELRAACGFNGPKMRSRFDGYITRLQMACRIVTEDFVYPLDKHNNEYGWGWALLNIPEILLGKEACRCPRTPQESFERLFAHLKAMVPQATEKQIIKLLQ